MFPRDYGYYPNIELVCTSTTTAAIYKGNTSNQPRRFGHNMPIILPNRGVTPAIVDSIRHLVRRSNPVCRLCAVGSLGMGNGKGV
jgi:hypothetical protein